MRYLAVYLFYAAVVIGGVVWYSVGPAWMFAMVLLFVYGALLVGDQFAFTRFLQRGKKPYKVYAPLYLALQTVAVLALLLIPPQPDFGAILLIPLSMQAVLWFEGRTGFVWIAAFVLLMVIPLVIGGSGSLSGLVLAVFYGTACYLVGSYAMLVKRADAVRRESDYLSSELQSANRNLVAYASQVEELTRAHERNRLARELHDSVTQAVFSMTLTVQAARILWDQDRGRVADQLDRVQVLAKGALDEIQMLVAQLRPSSISEEGFIAAVQRHIEDRKLNEGLHVCLEVVSNRTLPGPMTLGLLRIVQEALNNVVKHAGTSLATVRVDLAGTPASVEVQDNGAGFNTEVVTRLPGHYGLLGMNERAHDMGWRLKVTAQPGRGTCVRVEDVPPDDVVNNLANPAKRD